MLGGFGNWENVLKVRVKNIEKLNYVLYKGSIRYVYATSCPVSAQYIVYIYI